MGLCVNCVYHVTELPEESKVITRNFYNRIKFLRERFRKFPCFFNLGDGKNWCTNAENAYIDGVTGEAILAECHVKNTFEECQYFEEAEDEADEADEADTDDTNADTNDTDTNASGTADDTDT